MNEQLLEYAIEIFSGIELWGSQLFEMATKQAQIDFAFAVFWFVFLLALALVPICYAVYIVKKCPNDKDNEAIAALVLMSLLILLLAVFPRKAIINYLANPEWQAIRQIFSLIQESC